MASYLTPREVAERWSCSPRTVQRLCASGELPAMQLGLNKWRISLAALEAYEALRANTPSAETVQHAHQQPAREVHGAPKNPRYPHLWGMEPAPLAGKKKAALPR